VSLYATIPDSLKMIAQEIGVDNVIMEILNYLTRLLNSAGTAMKLPIAPPKVDRKNTSKT
jgi:hypothetical protein